MWFSPLKGAHLTLGQLDKTLPVDTSVAANKNIERGSFVYIKADNNGTAIAPRFALYGQIGSGSSAVDVATKPNAVPYIALMSVNDFQAGMAGNVGQAPLVEGSYATDAEGNNLTAATGGAATFINAAEVKAEVNGPRITAISVVQPAEYQTTAFEASGTYYVGCPLTISANGKLTPFSTGKNIVGYVTAVPKTRWINNLGDDKVGARITGGNAKVLEFSTAWIPVAAVNTADDPDTSGTDESANNNVGKLNVGAPKVQAAAPAAPAAPAAAAPKANTPAK